MIISRSYLGSCNNKCIGKEANFFCCVVSLLYQSATAGGAAVALLFLVARCNSSLLSCCSAHGRLSESTMSYPRTAVTPSPTTTSATRTVNGTANRRSSSCRRGEPEPSTRRSAEPSGSTTADDSLGAPRRRLVAVAADLPARDGARAGRRTDLSRCDHPQRPALSQVIDVHECRSSGRLPCLTLLRGWTNLRGRMRP